MIAAVQCEHISKVYKLYDSPASRLKEALHPFRKRYHHEFHALKDVTFHVEPGHVLGLIGENGAGKSTLLKILAGVTTASSGAVSIHGNVASLLELGSGFNQEFTGIENIYFQCSLMGYSKKTIDANLDAIIDFAEIGDFLYQPVKMYSSGMYMRLAFATATSVDPDILIIDEALSVGDQAFQKKCINRMMCFKEHKKTLLFCSHSMYHIQELCHQTIWLHNGCIRLWGNTADVVSEYLAYQEHKQPSQEDASVEVSSPVSDDLPEVTITDILLTNGKGEPIDRFEQFQSLVCRVKTRRIGSPIKGHLGVGLMAPGEQWVFIASTKESELEPLVFSGEQVTELVIPSLPLLSGMYQVVAIAGDRHGLQFFHRYYTNMLAVISKRPEFGILWFDHQWKLPQTLRSDTD